jgi:hypothetical protein
MKARFSEDKDNSRDNNNSDRPRKSFAEQRGEVPKMSTATDGTASRRAIKRVFEREK